MLEHGGENGALLPDAKMGRAQSLLHFQGGERGEKIVQPH